MLYNNGIEDIDMWREASRMFAKEKNGTDHMDMSKFYTADKFGLVIDMRSMADQLLHGSGTRLVNSHSGIQLQIDRKGGRLRQRGVPHIRHLRRPVQHYGQTV